MSYHLPTRVITHKQKVCSLYKRALRNLECWFEHRPTLRVQSVLLRERFDKNRNVKDLIVANQILKDGEEELYQTSHPSPIKFAHSPGGIAFERDAYVPDWVLDFWQPIEKAAYPEYFARREQRKKEYIKLWEKNFGRDP
ncbi:UNVERIFIED_CONTAM: hypothetical protein RMT77_009299 [Armadillidium vulgare]|nr:NADH dehydrogenase [ubiquinone] 1 beta subcomplex subunit 9 [Armadillidium vulgare]